MCNYFCFIRALKVLQWRIYDLKDMLNWGGGVVLFEGWRL